MPSALMALLVAVSVRAAPPPPAAGATGAAAEPAPCPAGDAKAGDAKPEAGKEKEEDGGSSVPSLTAKKDGDDASPGKGEEDAGKKAPLTCPVKREGKGRPGKKPWSFKKPCDADKLAKAEQCKDDPPEPKGAAAAAGAKAAPCAPPKESAFQKCAKGALKGAVDPSIEKAIAAGAKDAAGPGKGGDGKGKASDPKNSGELKKQNDKRRDFCAAAENYLCDMAAQFEAADDAAYALEKAGIIEPAEIEYDLQKVYDERSIFKSGPGGSAGPGGGGDAKKPDDAGKNGGEAAVLQHLAVKDLEHGFQSTAESGPMLEKLLKDGGGKGRYKLGEETAPLFEAARSFDESVKAVLKGEESHKPEKKKKPEGKSGSYGDSGKEYSLDAYKKEADALAKIQWDGCFELKQKHEAPLKGAAAKAARAKTKDKGSKKDDKKKKETLYELDEDQGAIAWDSFCEPAVVLSKLMEMLTRKGLTVKEARENMADEAAINASGRKTQLTGHEGDVLKKYGKANGSAVDQGEAYDGSVERGGEIGNPGAPSEKASGITENDKASPQMLREQGPAPLGTTKAGPTGGSGISAKGSGDGGGIMNWIMSWFSETTKEQQEAQEAADAAKRSANRPNP